MKITFFSIRTFWLLCVIYSIQNCQASMMEPFRPLISPFIAGTFFCVGVKIMELIDESRPICKVMPKMKEPLDLNDLDPKVRPVIQQLPQLCKDTTTAQVLILHGPAGTGKTTIARKLPEYLGFTGLEMPNYENTQYMDLQKLLDEIKKNAYKSLVIFIDEIDSYFAYESLEDTYKDFFSELLQQRLLIVGTTNCLEDIEYHNTFLQKKTILIDYLTPCLRKDIIAKNMIEFSIDPRIVLQSFLDALPEKMTIAELNKFFQEIANVHMKNNKDGKEIAHESCVRGIHQANAYFKTLSIISLQKATTTLIKDINIEIIQRMKEMDGETSRELHKLLIAISELDLPMQTDIYTSLIKLNNFSLTEIKSLTKKRLSLYLQETKESIIVLCNHIYGCSSTPEYIKDTVTSINMQISDFENKLLTIDLLLSAVEMTKDMIESLLNRYQQHWTTIKSDISPQGKIVIKKDVIPFKKKIENVCNGIKSSFSLNIFYYLNFRNYNKVSHFFANIPLFLLSLNIYLLYKNYTK